MKKKRYEKVKGGSKRKIRKKETERKEMKKKWRKERTGKGMDGDT